jgi:2-keto-4-pentenoate hydratase/2-oxohepta-3-ene-1,7-dioic acid hydratase in catechol pathway
VRLTGIRSADGARYVAELADGGARPIAGLREFWKDPEAALLDWPGRLASVAVVREFETVPAVPDSARVICIGLNYRDHVAEGSYRDDPYPDSPTVFARWTASLSVDGAPAPVPAGEQGLDWEGEVAAYVGRVLVDASAADARDAVLGFSVFNDLTARRAQKLTSQWTVGKNGDATGPLGPLVTADEVGDLRDGLNLTTRVNGVTVQHGNTRDQIYELGEVLSFLSRAFTLRPGDVVATGTPAGVGYARTPPWLLHPGDVVTVEAGKLGTVSTPIVGNDARHLS